jgi:hypothetical protein
MGLHIMPSLLKTSDKKDRQFVVKMTYKDFEEIKKQADKYTRGNISDWIRYAAKLEPREEDVRDDRDN